MIKKNEILETIDKNQENIKKLGVKRIGIFGSFAKNSARRTSDIDVLVEFHQKEKTFDNYMELKEFLQKKLRRKIDLVLRDTLKSRLKSAVLKDIRYARL